MLRKITKKLIKTAFSSEKGMDDLLDKMISLIEQNSALEAQNQQQVVDLLQLREQVACLQQVIDKLTES